MATDPRGRRLYCTRCGAPATHLVNTMDPAHPIGECQRGWSPQGRVVATYDRSEVERVLESMREARARRNHAVHVRDGLRPRSCPACSKVGTHDVHVRTGRIERTCPECITAVARTAPPDHGR